MKKYLPILLIILLSSCEKLFHENEYEEQVVPDLYQEKIDIINSIYARLVNVHDEYYFCLLCRGDDLNTYYRTENKCGYYRKGANIPPDYQEIIGNLYKNLYISIVNANSVIMYTNEDENPEVLGEIYFLRAYCYFKLARFFGTPPLVKDNIINYTLPKPGYREVYDFIVSDLQKAIELLPDTYTECRIVNETPHKGSAKALLAEVYLSMAGYPVNDTAKYRQAADLSREIIENEAYYGFSLLNDFTGLWKEENKHNPENIFGLFFDIKNSPVENRFGLLDNRLGPLQSRLKTELKFYDKFPDNYRKRYSMTTGYYSTHVLYETNDTIIYFNKFNTHRDPCTFKDEFCSLKWNDYKPYYIYHGQVTVDNGVEFRYSPKRDNTIYLLRYAHTLLTYAEAKGHLGEVDEPALLAVNRVRRRSYHVDLNNPSKYDLESNLTPELFTDSVVWERAWEFFSEPDSRWFDIIRLDLKDKLTEYRYTKDYPDIIDDKFISNDWYFYLIPQEDRWLNPNFEKEETEINE